MIGLNAHFGFENDLLAEDTAGGGLLSRLTDLGPVRAQQVLERFFSGWMF